MPSGRPVGPVSPEMISAEIHRVALIVEKDPAKVSHFDMKEHGNIPERRILQAGGLTKIKNLYIKALEPANDAQIRDTAEMRSQIALLRREKGDIDSLIHRIEKAVEDVPVIKPNRYQAKKSNKKFKRNIQLTISDTHFGSDLDPRETGFKYGPVEESRAMAYIVKNVCDYKLERREETELTVNILGDIIENHLHAGGASEALHIQTCRAINLMTQFLDTLSNNFLKVTVNFSVGNHGRDKGIHPKRATATKYNAVETTIYYFLEAGRSEFI